MIGSMALPLTASVKSGGSGLGQLSVTTINPSAIPFVFREEEDSEAETCVIEGLGVTGLPKPRYAG